MSKKTFLFSFILVLVLLVGLTTSAFAEAPNSFMALSGADAANFALPADVQLINTTDLANYGLTMERYQQTFGDAQVFGAQLTVYRNADGEAVMVSGSHYTNLAPSNAVGLSKADARGIASRDIGADGHRLVTLMVNPADGTYFYEVETRRDSSRWVHWVNASNGQQLNKFNALTDACGSVPAPCGFGVGYDDGDSTDIKNLTGLTTFSGGSYALNNANGRIETHDQGSSKKPFLGPIATDSDNSWILGGNASPAQGALIDTHYYANVTDLYFNNVHSYDWIAASIADPQSSVTKIIAHAHYQVRYDNAFWNGSYIAIGDGSGTTFRELSALDVIGHELTHAVTDFTSNLVYQNESGALNEAFSDMMGNSIEFYADSSGLEPGNFTPDWFIGEDIYIPEMGTAQPGFRNMADPEEDGDPDHYSERYTGTNDNGGVHSNSGIANHAYYLLVNGGQNASCASPSNHNSAHCSGSPTVTGVGLAKAEAITFMAFTGLTPNATFCQARTASEAAASALYGSAEAQSTSDAWAAVGACQ